MTAKQFYVCCCYSKALVVVRPGFGFSGVGHAVRDLLNGYIDGNHCCIYRKIANASESEILAEYQRVVDLIRAAGISCVEEGFSPLV